MSNLDINQNLYLTAIKNLKSEDEEVAEKIKRHFNIIQVFANQKTLEKLKAKEVELNEPKILSKGATLDLEENHVHVTDIHGDLGGLLFALVGNNDKSKNPAKFKDNEQKTVFYNIINGTIIKDLSTLSEEERTKFVPIPNLEPNPDFIGTFTMGGDVIDRGDESESCFYTMAHLLNLQTEHLKKNPEEKEKIEFLIGNHEEFLLINDFDSCLGNRGNITYGYFENRYETSTDFEERFEFMRKTMLQLLKNNQVKICSAKGKTIISHVSFVKETVNTLLNFLQGIKFVGYSTEGKEINQKSKEAVAALGIDVIKIKKLQDKINKNDKLNENDVALLSDSINKFATYAYQLNEKDEEGLEIPDTDKATIKQIFNKNGVFGLLWNRYTNLKENTVINDLKQLIGHDRNENENIEIIKINGYEYLLVDLTITKGYDITKGKPLEECYIRTKGNVIAVRNGNIVKESCIFDIHQLDEIYKEVQEQLIEQENQLIDSLKKENRVAPEIQMSSTVQSITQQKELVEQQEAADLIEQFNSNKDNYALFNHYTTNTFVKAYLDVKNRNIFRNYPNLLVFESLQEHPIIKQALMLPDLLNRESNTKLKKFLLQNPAVLFSKELQNNKFVNSAIADTIDGVNNLLDSELMINYLIENPALLFAKELQNNPIIQHYNALNYQRLNTELRNSINKYLAANPSYLFDSEFKNTSIQYCINCYPSKLDKASQDSIENYVLGRAELLLSPDHQNNKIIKHNCSNFMPRFNDALLEVIKSNPGLLFLKEIQNNKLIKAFHNEKYSEIARSLRTPINAYLMQNIALLFDPELQNYQSIKVNINNAINVEHQNAVTEFLIANPEYLFNPRLQEHILIKNNIDVNTQLLEPRLVESINNYLTRNPDLLFNQLYKNRLTDNDYIMKYYRSLNPEDLNSLENYFIEKPELLFSPELKNNFIIKRVISKYPNTLSPKLTEKINNYLQYNFENYFLPEEEDNLIIKRYFSKTLEDAESGLSNKQNKIINQ